jgi:uncharacterized protein YigA (DUF484 family)
MFDKINESVSYERQKGKISETLTLKRQFGYEFTYKGNGLNKEDLKEIKKALKKMEPLLEKFLKNEKTNDKIVSNFSHYIKSLLPKTKNEEHLNAVKKHVLDKFDEILKKIKVDLEKLNDTKKLFENIFDDAKKLEIFA